MKLEEIIKIELKKLVEEKMQSNYMFFSNLEQIKRQCELLLEFDRDMVNNILTNGHDWADDHISSAKENIDQVFDFLMNEKEGNGLNEAKNLAQQAAIAINMKKHGKKPKNESEKEMYEAMEIDESKNCPTDPAKWSASKAAAKAKFDVYPSAYANGWAAKNYKAKGGGWKKCK
jgi:hypothetical protein